MQRQRHQAIAAREARCGKTPQVQRRSARDDNLGELLALLAQRSLLVHRMLEVRHAEQRCAKQLFIVLEILRRILHEQAIRRLQHDRGQLGEKQRFAALNLVDAHLVMRFGKNFGERLAVGKTAFFDMQLRAEYPRGRVGHRRRAIG